jgi:hypothetical protein
MARFGGVLADLLVFLAGDLEKLRARYEIAVLDRTEGLALAATPTAEDVKSQMRTLELRLAPDLWTLRVARITEAAGDTSVIMFRQVKRDVPVAPAKMRPPSAR